MNLRAILVARKLRETMDYHPGYEEQYPQQYQQPLQPQPVRSGWGKTLRNVAIAGALGTGAYVAGTAGLGALRGATKAYTIRKKFAMLTKAKGLKPKAYAAQIIGNHVGAAKKIIDPITKAFKDKASVKDATFWMDRLKTVYGTKITRLVPKNATVDQLEKFAAEAVAKAQGVMRKYKAAEKNRYFGPSYQSAMWQGAKRGPGSPFETTKSLFQNLVLGPTSRHVNRSW